MTKRLYRVDIECSTVVAAESEREAVDVLTSLISQGDLSDEIADGVSWVARAIDDADGLPPSWKGADNLIPWNDDDDKTVGQYLAELGGGKDA